MVTTVGQSKPQEDKELHDMTSQVINFIHIYIYS